MNTKLARWMMLVSMLVACSAGAVVESASSVAEAQQAPAAQQSAEAKMAEAYLAVHERLASDDSNGAKAAYAKLVLAARAVPGPAAAKLKSAAERAVDSSDIALQRSTFELVSEALIDFVRLQGNPLSFALRRVRCPMAFEGRGARWLQRGEKIENPYYGAQMLRCGTVEGTIAPGQRG